MERSGTLARNVRIAIAVAVGSAVAVLIAAVVTFYRRRRRRCDDASVTGDPDPDPSYRVHELPGLLTAAECDALIAIAAAAGLEPSAVVDPDTGRSVRRDAFRRSAQAWLTDAAHPAAARLSAAVAALTGAPPAHQEPLQVVRYDPAGRFDAHHDACVSADRTVCAAVEGTAGPRRATLLVYLSDDFVGGATVFPRAGRTVVPEKGKGVWFWNTRPDGSVIAASLHRGDPVVAGVKWIANKWTHDRPVGGGDAWVHVHPDQLAPPPPLTQGRRESVVAAERG